MSSISVAIPNYRRLTDLEICLNSIYNQNVSPSEVLLHDDASPNKEELESLIYKFSKKFSSKGIKFKYKISKTNVGYDCSLRSLLNISSSDYTLFIGNDDYLLPNAIEVYERILSKTNYLMYSRAFSKFNSDDINHFTGTSSFHKTDYFFKETKESHFSLRLSAYFGGLLFNTSWANKIATSKFDGTLYYQYYLSCHAFFDQGIYYINETTVAARNDGIPLFSESTLTSEHSDGAYSNQARLKMWSDILDITTHIEDKFSVKFINAIQKELKVRMSFHVFEMYCSLPKNQLIFLFKSFFHAGFIQHPIPLFFFTVNYIFGSKSKYVYLWIRKIFQ